jgi:hypothetical protein
MLENVAIDVQLLLRSTELDLVMNHCRDECDRADEEITVDDLADILEQCLSKPEINLVTEVTYHGLPRGNGICCSKLGQILEGRCPWHRDQSCYGMYPECQSLPEISAMSLIDSKAAIAYLDLCQLDPSNNHRAYQRGDQQTQPVSCGVSSRCVAAASAHPGRASLPS